MHVDKVISKPPKSASCPKCKGPPFRQGGVMFRVDLSRLEEGLGHEAWRCDKCGYVVKYVPKERM